MKPRFLLDEHINRAIQRQLRRQTPELEILAIGDPGAPSAGIADQDILNWIEENQYILVTENRSTMPKHLSNHFTSGKHIPGILWVRKLMNGLIHAIINSSYIKKGINYERGFKSEGD
jgi:hypothetical protein